MPEQAQTKTKLVLLDVDGVLSDFCGGALTLIGKGRGDSTCLAALQSGSHIEFEALFGGRSEFENVITRGGRAFWMSLDKFEWADRLIDTIQEFSVKIGFLTSFGSWPESAGYKIEYLQQWRPEIPVFLGKEKWLLANPANMLVDDYGLNVRNYVDNCGRVYHWPNPELLIGSPELVDATLEDLRRCIETFVSCE